MKRAAARGLFALVLLTGLLACNGADIAVFAGAAAGSAGSAGKAGAGGFAGAVSPGGSAGAVSAGGSAGALDAGGGLAGGADASEGVAGGEPFDGGAEIACQRNAECSDTFYCQTQSCQRGASGVCAVKQPVCDSTLKPVCGCDHYTYWNDCLREQYGISSSTDGACSVGARTCRTNSDCQGVPGATCAHLLPPGVACGTSTGPGTCWVTPPDCQMTGDTRRWQSCPPPGGGCDLGPCVSTCEAVKAGHPFIVADSAICP